MPAAAPFTPPSGPPGRILSREEVQQQTTFSRTTIWRRIKQGTFPKPSLRDGQKRGWAERDIEAWKAEREAQATI